MATSYDVELEKIKRQQKIADAMTVSGLEPIQTNRTAGPYVAPVHWAEVLGKWGQAYAGRRGSDKAADKQLEIVKAQETARAQEFARYIGGGAQAAAPTQPAAPIPEPAPTVPQQPGPVQQEQPAQQFQARGLMADILEGTGVRPVTKSPGVRERYTGPVDNLPGYLQTQAPAPTAAATPGAPTTPAPNSNPFASQMAQLRQQMLMAQTMAFHPDAQLAALGAAEVKRIGELQQKYEEATITEPWKRVVGNSLVNSLDGTELGYFGNLYGAPTVMDAGDGQIVIAKEIGGRAPPTMRAAPFRGAGTTVTVDNRGDTAFATAAGKDTVDRLSGNLKLAGTAFNQIGLADGLDRDIQILQGSGLTTGPLTNVRNTIQSLALELGMTLPAGSLTRLGTTKAIDATGVNQLIDLFNQPGMSAYGLTAGETGELKRTLAAGTQPLIVLQQLSQRLRVRANATLRDARSQYNNARLTYGDVPGIDVYNPDIRGNMRYTTDARPGSSRDNPRPLP